MHNLEQHWVLGFYRVSCNFQEVNLNIVLTKLRIAGGSKLTIKKQSREEPNHLPVGKERSEPVISINWFSVHTQEYAFQSKPRTTQSVTVHRWDTLESWQGPSWKAFAGKEVVTAWASGFCPLLTTVPRNTYCVPNQGQLFKNRLVFTEQFHS